MAFEVVSRLSLSDISGGRKGVVEWAASMSELSEAEGRVTWQANLGRVEERPQVVSGVRSAHDNHYHDPHRHRRKDLLQFA